ncbi:aspartic proteinase CDR1-like [Tripterygium wilfordii]|uniref:aspartic proteinase CDR1-like n=1 Tax=Tripterygium wilfordii TaxID=458696 RepID=UPI0018F81615|nr:aspartic proteinase CDR1-like [Tripterygium wilfordii]
MKTTQVPQHLILSSLCLPLASTMPHFIFILILILFINAFILYPIEAEMNSVSFDLIHHDSKLSLFYNSSMTESEVSLKAVMRSLNRLNHFNSSMSIDAKYVQSELIAEDYFMTFAISDRTSTRLAIPNMGSDLIWLAMLCNILRMVNQMSVDTGINIAAMDFSSSGVLGNETFYFRLPDNKYREFPKIVFGCDDAHKDELKGAVEGVVGLGQGLLSLVAQFGREYKKFSYCLVEKSTEFYSKIKFGSHIKLYHHEGQEYNVKFTQNPQDPHYYLNLESISVNGNKINLPNTQHLSMAVDIQTAHASLPPHLYAQVIAMFTEQASRIMALAS